jgi:hypothetical protein
MTLEAITIGREARMMLGADTYCFGQFDNQTTREIVKNPDTICGDIDPPVNRMRKGRKIVRGSIMLDPTYAQLVALLPWLGVTTVSSGVYNLGAADALLEKNCKFDLGGAQHDWSNVIVLGYAFRGSKGGRPVSLQINIEGEDETEAGSAFSDNPLAINKLYSFTDIATRQLDNAEGSLTSRPIDRFLIQVDNRVVSEHNSSITRTGAKVGDRQAIFATSVPYTSTHKDLYWNYRDSEGSVEAKIKLTNSGGSLEFFMPHTVPITKGPSVIGKPDQIRTPVTLEMQRGDSTGTRVSPMTMTLTAP